MSKERRGSLVISLDCELYWGVHDKRSLEEYRERLIGDRRAVPRLLDMFQSFGIKATWAFVGFLFFDNRNDLEQSTPKVLPEYKNTRFSPYQKIKDLGQNENTDPFHFGKSLIDLVRKDPHQEIASHTFSHLYVLEEGVTNESIRDDLAMAQDVAVKSNLSVRSLVFPRNQYDQRAITIARETGFLTFRGNPRSWLYDPRNGDEESLLRRGIRLVDSYLPISGSHSYDQSQIRDPKITGTDIYNVRASRFLRPYSRMFRVIEPLKLWRIRSEMTRAAKKGRIYHLWWHPHNFGRDPDENFANLKNILSHYSHLKDTFGFESRTMLEVCAK